MSLVKPKVFWPLTITAANGDLNIRIAGVTYTATIAPATYYRALDLISAIQGALESIGGGAVLFSPAVSVNSTGHFIINTTTDGVQSILKFSITTNSIASILGWPDADTASAFIQTSPYPHQNGWYCPVVINADTLPIRDRKMDVVTRTMEGQTKFLSESELINRTLIFKWLPAWFTYKAFETTPYLNTAIERWWESGHSRFRYWPDGTAEGTYYDYVMDLETIKTFKPERQFPKKGLYSFSVGCFGYVAP